MQTLNLDEIEMVSGSGEKGMDIVYNVAAGAFAGACIGFLIGGPVGAIAGGISGGAHSGIVTYVMAD
jgi:osmotically inducible lipoprotein OsmB